MLRAPAWGYSSAGRASEWHSEVRGSIPVAPHSPSAIRAPRTRGLSIPGPRAGQAACEPSGPERRDPLADVPDDRRPAEADRTARRSAVAAGPEESEHEITLDRGHERLRRLVGFGWPSSGEHRRSGPKIQQLARRRSQARARMPKWSRNSPGCHSDRSRCRSRCRPERRSLDRSCAPWSGSQVRHPVEAPRYAARRQRPWPRPTRDDLAVESGHGDEHVTEVARHVERPIACQVERPDGGREIWSVSA